MVHFDVGGERMSGDRQRRGDSPPPSVDPATRGPARMDGPRLGGGRVPVVDVSRERGVAARVRARPSLIAAAAAAWSAAAVPTALAQSRPLQADRCRALATEFAKAIGLRPAMAMTGMGAAKLPYVDHVPAGSACIFTAEGKGRRAVARAGARLAEWAILLHDRGWTEDDGLTTDGGDDPQTGLRKGAARLAFHIEDHPAAACRDLGPDERCRAPDGAHTWVFRAAAYER